MNQSLYRISFVLILALFASAVHANTSLVFSEYSVTSGRTDASSAFDPSMQWTGFPEDTFADLGHYGAGGSGDTVAFGACGDNATPIDAIQGRGAASPLVGKTRVIEAIITGDFAGEKALNGFFVQQADNEVDTDPATSEGLFIYAGSLKTRIKPGERVRVRGQVAEYHGETELRRVDEVAVCGSGYSVKAAQLSLPLARGDGPEALEDMRVNITQKLTVTGNDNLGRYGELTLAAGGRLFTPTNVVPPGAAARALAKLNARDRLVLDDGSTRQDPDPVIYPSPQLSAFNTVRDGDTVTGLQGILAYSFGAWQVEPVKTPVFDPVNGRPDASVLPSGGNLRVASFNVENFFNGDGAGGGFPTARGADTYAEYVRQRAKTVAALAALHADVIGLMEVENDGYGSKSAIQDLVKGLNAAAPAGAHYAFVDPGRARLGTDAIAVDIIYNTAKVSPKGRPATLLTPPFDYGNRPPLAQTFATPRHAKLTLVVNHLRSKGGCPHDGSANADQGDGQGCWNATRVRAAREIANWLAGDPTQSNDPNFLGIGDLNSYLREDPIRVLNKAGLVSLLKRKAGIHNYTYTFDAQSGSLDHALASKPLTKQVLAVKPFHIDADEPSIIDYNEDYKQPDQIASDYNPGPYRASDHDPLVIELSLSRSPHKHKRKKR